MTSRQAPLSDYERVARAIAFIGERVTGQPSLSEIAAHLHLSPFHFQRLFARWAGLTPKRFLQALTLERAKRLLGESRPLLEVSDSLGLSSGSRLYDHFVRLEAITPGEHRTGGRGLTIEHGVHGTLFGRVFIALTARGVCHLAFLDETREADAQRAGVQAQWPRAALRENRSGTRAVIDAMFRTAGKPKRPLSLHVAGTNFQINVWKALLQIPPGSVTSYARLAAAIGRPGAARAVGRAVASNPAAFLIPCHRVIRENGALGGYRWGETRKRALLAWEAARQE